jgi:flavin reductase (DIM6/NTAB) family NADH-FMN oxidoreductase RutF
MNDTLLHRPQIDPALFRRVMGRFASGVTVITVESGGSPHGMTANAFFSGSLDPPLFVVSVAKRANMHRRLTENSRFAVNILAAGQERYAAHFAGKPDPALAPAFAPIAGVPTLSEACARIVADIAARHECGDHSLFIGHIRHMESDPRPPLIYHDGRFAALVHHRDDEPVPVTEFW